MTIFPSISPVGLFGVGGLGSLLPVANATSTTASGSVSLLSSGSTLVELSGLGQLLSAVSIFQNRLAVLRPGSAESGLGRNFGTDFGSLSAEVQHFIDTFNGLQGSLNSLNGIFGTFSAASPLTRIANDLNEQVFAVFDNGDSALTRLSDLGIVFEPFPLSGFVGSLSLDLETLRSAFDSDPEGAFSLLTRAVDAFQSLATDVTGPVDNTSSLFATQLQFTATQLSLNLFGDTSGSLNTALRGFGDLFALASLGETQTDTQARLLVALNEFALVSSLVR